MRVNKVLQVLLSGQHVGVLERTHTGLTRWLPDAAWELGGQRPRLGLNFLRSPGYKQVGTGLPTWFENLLPEEGSALRYRLVRLHGIRRSTDSYGLLSVLGRDLPGAVQIDAPEGSEGVGTPTEVSEAAEETGSEQEAPAYVEPSRFRFSLAGAQFKLSMGAFGQKFAMTSRSGQGHWIVKLPDLDHPDLPDIEAATMRWAQAAGHEVPRNFALDVERIEGLPPEWARGIARAYAIERFDRRVTGLRIHHEDFCQAFDLLPEHKYGDTGLQQAEPRYAAAFCRRRRR